MVLLYHAAMPKNRASIAAHGLDATLGERLSSRRAYLILPNPDYPAGIYLWDDLDACRDWGQQWGPAVGADIWAVDASGLELLIDPETGPTPGQPQACYIKGPVPRAQITLVEAPLRAKHLPNPDALLT